MSKQTKGYDMANFAHVTPQTLTRAQKVLDDQKLRRYSVSAIYKAHNEIFKLREPMQTCDSCLVTRANNVKKFMDWYAAQQPGAAPAVPSLPAPGSSTDVTAYSLEDGTTILVDAAGLARLAHADRSPVTDLDAVAPGDYLLKDGQTLTIAEGSIATTVAIKDPTKIEQAAGDLLGGVVKNIDGDGDVGGDDHHADDLAGVNGSTNEGAEGTTDGTQAAGTTDNAAQGTADGAGTAAPAGSIVLQKVDKDTYVADGDAFYAVFTASADDATKGTVVRVDTGKAVAAGTYATQDTTKVLGVQPGGKATYKTIA